ncbi:MAG: Sulfonate transport system substrate-binding protein, partial [Collimonas fungivorans]|nr:Sulfonate transport system substrate-binding protein [Collimonas fungivorans]
HPKLVPVDAQITAQLQKIADTFYEAKLFPIRVDAAKLADTRVFPPP